MPIRLYLPIPEECQGLFPIINTRVSRAPRNRENNPLITERVLVVALGTGRRILCTLTPPRRATPPDRRCSLSAVIIMLVLLLYSIVYVCMVITYSKSKDQPGKVANSLID